MSVINKMLQHENKSVRMFANALDSLRRSQGFYQRLYDTINDVRDDCVEDLIKQIEKKDFNDVLDVVLYLEEEYE